MSFRVDPSSTTPPSQQIVDWLLDRVASGELAAGDRLPSVRQLAEQALVNPNTVGRAYRDLEWLGVAVGRNGCGVFVTADGPSLARARRLDATRAAFVAALEHALRAGHTPLSLAQLFELHATEVQEGIGER